jgi:fluoride ion exporter CrcB/FEX
MFKQLYSSVVSNPWLCAPAGGVLLFAAILHFILRRPTPGAQRGGLLFGVGFIAVLATGVFAAFAYSLVRLMVSGRANFDLVWSVGAIVAGMLAVWLWLRFVRLWRRA